MKPLGGRGGNQTKLIWKGSQDFRPLSLSRVDAMQSEFEQLKRRELIN